MSNIVTITDTASGSIASISVDVGFNCFKFQTVVNGQTVDVIAANDNFPEQSDKPSWSGIPLLFPFPNRIRNGQYNWEGQDYFIPDTLAAYDADGNAIHGFCLDRPWRVIEQGENLTWNVIGCCGSCYVLTEMIFCPFCGTKLVDIEFKKEKMNVIGNNSLCQ